MESDVLKAVEEISGYTPDEMLDMYNDYGRMAKEWEAYAGTGLIPEEIAHAKDLLSAEQDGRLVTLPCKVGDTVWVRDRDGRPREMILDAPDIRCHCAKEDEVCMALCGSKNTGVCAYRLKNDGSDIGKTVFLTRAEAEKALEKEAQS